MIELSESSGEGVYRVTDAHLDELMELIRAEVAGDGGRDISVCEAGEAHGVSCHGEKISSVADIRTVRWVRWDERLRFLRGCTVHASQTATMKIATALAPRGASTRKADA